MHPYLLKGVSLGPAVVRRILDMIPSEKYDTAIGDDRFTIREVIAHLADWEVLFRSRMEDALANPRVAIVTYDEGERAIERNYAATSVDEQFSQYETERAKTVAFLSGLSKDQFRAPYTHPSLGSMVIEDQANMLVGHDMYHIEQLTEHLSTGA